MLNSVTPVITPMQDVPKPVLATFEQTKNQENARLELRRIKGHYYVYKVRNEWNKQQRKPLKITKILGSITPDGVYHPKRQKTLISTTKVYEYGSSELCLQLSQDIQNATANMP